MASLFGQFIPIETVSVTADGGIKKEIIRKGEGATPAVADEVWAHYTGKLLDGQTFDSSVSRGKPFIFLVGLGQVISGWDKGFASMQKGEKAVLTIEPSYGYGAAGAGGVIPPNATLAFEVELLDFGRPGEAGKGLKPEPGMCSVQ